VIWGGGRKAPNRWKKKKKEKSSLPQFLPPPPKEGGRKGNFKEKKKKESEEGILGLEIYSTSLRKSVREKKKGGAMQRGKGKRGKELSSSRGFLVLL